MTKVLGFAATIVFFVFASGAFAEPPEGKGNKGGFDISNLALMDSDPLGSKEVGTVIAAIDKDFVLTLLTFVDSLGTERNILLKAGKNGIQVAVGGFSPVGGWVGFEGTFCSGTAYFDPRIGLQPAFDPSVVIKSPSGSSELVLYTSADDQPVNATINSASGNIGGCGNAPSPEIVSNVVPAEILDTDLHTSFPPPYALVVK